MDPRLNNAPCGYFSITTTGIIDTANQTFLDMLLYDKEALVGQHIETVMTVTNKLFFHTYFYPYIQLYGHVNEMYFSFRTSDQQEMPVLLNGIRHERDGESFIDCVVVEMRKRIEHEKDILQTKTKLEQLYQATNEANKKLELLHAEYETKQQVLTSLNEQLEALAATDPLTGLKNRRFFQANLLAKIALYQQTSLPFSVFMVDIDHFKKINDTYGHPIGDLVLTRLAQPLLSITPEDAIVARFGGEEFVILLPNTDEKSGFAAAQSYCAQTAAASWGEYNITVSVGVAAISPVDTDATVLEKADQALYASKANGRNRATHWTSLVKTEG